MSILLLGQIGEHKHMICHLEFKNCVDNANAHHNEQRQILVQSNVATNRHIYVPRIF